MLTPEYLQRLPDSVVELYAQAEADILADMARRINGFDLFIPSAQYQMSGSRRWAHSARTSFPSCPA